VYAKFDADVDLQSVGPVCDEDVVLSAIDSHCSSMLKAVINSRCVGVMSICRTHCIHMEACSCE
jgi:hypothetical protein